MPSFRTHLLGGLVVGVIGAALSFYYNIFDIYYSLLLVPIALMYSILPDVDIKTSKAFHIVNNALLIAAAIYVYLDDKIAAYVVLATMMVMMHLRHRGIVHTFIAGLILSLPVVEIGWFGAAMAFLAYCSHLLLDGVVKESIQR